MMKNTILFALIKVNILMFNVYPISFLMGCQVQSKLEEIRKRNAMTEIFESIPHRFTYKPPARVFLSKPRLRSAACSVFRLKLEICGRFRGIRDDLR